jgi:dTDP-4-amino-4,6-dideoxy-D-galactose acyltransferase
MPSRALCQFLEWDTNFFGRRIGQAAVHRLNSADMQAVLDWCNSQQIDCLYFLSDPNDADTVRLAENNGFRLVDIRLELSKRLAGNTASSLPVGSAIRLSQPEDVPALQAIARVSHRDSRFYFDANFPDELCDRFYETWIANSCRGYADSVLVAVHEGGPVGYISCHLAGPGRGKIGLLAVSQNVQGQGVGKAMVEAALGWFAGQEVNLVTVVTQGRNAVAQLLYQQCGFMTASVQLWYHRWFR